MRVSASAPRPRVVILVQNTSLPNDRRVWLEATTLVSAQFEVAGICPELGGLNRSRECVDGITVHRYRLPFNAAGSLGFVAESLWCFLASTALLLKVALVGGGYDILHICNPPEVYWPLAFISRLCGKRVVFDHHDLSPEMYRAKFGDGGRMVFRALRLFERLTFRAADVVLATNESYRDVATTRGRCAPADVYVVRSGPPVERLRSHPPDPSLRKGKRHLVGYAGEICQQDGVDHLMRALEILRDEHGRDDFHCLVIGGGPHQPAIREYATRIGVADLCTFTGHVSSWTAVEDWCRLLSSLDVGVEPNPLSEWADKSTMNKVLDYMCFGVPVVAYELTENRRSADAAAEYVTPNDERALAAGIAALLDDPARRERMGHFGHERLHRALSWEHSAPHLLAAYSRLADRVPA